MDRLSGAISGALRGHRTAGFGAVREFAWRTYLRHGRRLEAHPVLDADWDLLVVLDACRADLWAEVAASGNLPIGTTRLSPGGTSREWLRAVFDGHDASGLADVGYVTAHPASEEVVSSADLGHLGEVWRYAWDDRVGAVPARQVTDAAVRVGRESDLDRLIVHYLQPASPTPSADDERESPLENFEQESLAVWDDLRAGRRSVRDVWRQYRENLEAVHEEVALLCANVDAETAVVTADHGVSFGERGIYGQAEGVALRSLREVPWVETTASDRRTYELAGETGPAAQEPDEADGRLQQLGRT